MINISNIVREAFKARNHLHHVLPRSTALPIRTIYHHERYRSIVPPTLRFVRPFSSDMTQHWPEGIKKFLEREKISKPTLIQEKTLPLAMNNRDLVGIARTGSGKTLAFVIPAAMKIIQQREQQQSQLEDDDQDSIKRTFGSNHGTPPTCLVLAPTRELASQTADVVQKFRHLGIKSISLVGGASRNDQVRQLTGGEHDFYIATPGRLMDLIDSEIVDLSNIKYLVLDEADRMLDMGFEPQIRKILSQIPKNRQTLMFSATWPSEIKLLAEEFMNDYEYIAVDSETLKANPNIKQIIEICEPSDKIKLLLNHLKRFEQEVEDPRSLVFVNTKRLADTLLLHLMKNRMKAIALHGDRSQNQRDTALRLFRNNHCHIMVATDVAARGLDIDDISHVVNFDFPNTIEDYIHRIGRTARHDKTGTALTLFTVNNSNLAGRLIRVLRETNQEIPAELEDLARNKHKYLGLEPRDFTKKRFRDSNDFYSGGPSSNRYQSSYGSDRNRPSYGGNRNQSSYGGGRSFGGNRNQSIFGDESTMQRSKMNFNATQVREFHSAGSKVRYLDFRYRFNTCHLRTHLLIIRRQKMKKHQRTKFRKKYKCLLAKRRLKREIAKEKAFRVELLTYIRRAEQFDPKEYALRKIHEINNKPRELTREESIEQLKDLIREHRYQTDYLKPKHRRAETYGLEL